MAGGLVGALSVYTRHRHRRGTGDKTRVILCALTAECDADVTAGSVESRISSLTASLSKNKSLSLNYMAAGERMGRGKTELLANFSIVPRGQASV